MQIVTFRDWELEVDRELTSQTYDKIDGGGSDGCSCDECKNYVALRNTVFPTAVRELFNELGIDYRKEVEIVSFDELPNGQINIGGWFHFKGQIISGKDFRIPLSGGNGYTLDLTKIEDNFSIGFAEISDLAFFENKEGLVQIEFSTSVPWVIERSLKDD